MGCKQLRNQVIPDKEPSTEEFNLIRLLVEKANYSRPNWDVGLRVAEMQDGMGSLLLMPKGQLNKNRLFIDCISEITIKDYDGNRRMTFFNYTLCKNKEKLTFIDKKLL